MCKISATEGGKNLPSDASAGPKVGIGLSSTSTLALVDVNHRNRSSRTSKMSIEMSGQQPSAN